MYFIIGVIVLLLLAFATKAIFKNKGKKGGFWLGFLLGIIGLLIAIISRPNEEYLDEQQFKKEIEQYKSLLESKTISKKEFDREVAILKAKYNIVDEQEKEVKKEIVNGIELEDESLKEGIKLYERKSKNHPDFLTLQKMYSNGIITGKDYLEELRKLNKETKEE